MEPIDDETLLDSYFAGDAEAFLEFYRRHSGRVLGYARSKGLSTEFAEEVRQEAFLRLHRSIHQYEQGRPALPWFFTIVHSCLIDAVRSSKRLSRARDGLADDGGFVGPVDEGPELNFDGALAALTVEQRRIFELKVLEEKSFKDISLSVGKNEVTLRKSFERARVKLKQVLKGGKI